MSVRLWATTGLVAALMLPLSPGPDAAYYLLYHGIGNDNCPPPGCLPGHHGYQVGGATAQHPLGPWTKLPENPLLQPGALSAWDGGMVASSNIVKMGEGNWTMW